MTFPLGEHFFRHEYGSLVAVLVRRFGVARLELVEDAVQAALLVAVEFWSTTEVPENPSAWLFRVAHNHCVGELRQRAGRDALLAAQAEPTPQSTEEPPLALAGDLQDSLLRMLFVCCDPSIPVESQLVLALKTLCGFDVSEIAQRLFTTEANVYKRLTRARARLRETQLLAEEVPLSSFRRDCPRFKPSSTRYSQKATFRHTRRRPFGGSCAMRRVA